ncbi:hypothetical protein P8452_36448 [Trifolium repens]|nr:hypothetical protein P8452_36448 [Trifolium repens]
MKLLKKLHLLQILLLFNLILCSSIHHQNHKNYCEFCKGCEKPNGSCGAGLNCLCHPKECTDKVISKVGSVKSTGNVFFSFLSFIVMPPFLMLRRIKVKNG